MAETNDWEPAVHPGAVDDWVPAGPGASTTYTGPAPIPYANPETLPSRPVTWSMLAAEAGRGLTNTLMPGGFLSMSPGGLELPPAEWGLASSRIAYPDFGTDETAAAHPWMAAGARGLGGAVPWLAAGGGLPAFMANLGGAFGAEAGSYVTPGSAVGPIVGGLAGGYAGGGIGSGVGRVANALTGNVTPEAQAALTLGVPMTAPSLVSAKGAHSLTPYTDVGLIQQNLGSATERVASGLGDSRTLQDVGTIAQNEAQNWLSTVAPAKHAAAWAPVDSVIPQTTPVALTGYRNALEDMNKTVGEMSASQRGLLPKGISNLLGNLNADFPQTSSRFGVGEPGPGIAPPIASWASAQRTATLLGEAVGNPEIEAGSVGDRQLRTAYAAIRGDMRDIAVQNGVGDQFDAAKAESDRLFSFQKNVVGRIMNSKDPNQNSVTPEGAANNLLGTAKKGGTTLTQMAQELPQTTSELGALKLRQAGLEDPTDATASMSQPGKFVSAFSPKNLSPEARNILYPPGPVGDKVDALETLAQRTAQIGKATPAEGLMPSSLDVMSNLGVGSAAGAVLSGLGSHFAPGSEIFGGEVGALAGAGVGAARNATMFGLARPAFARGYAAGLPAPPLFPGANLAAGAIQGQGPGPWPHPNVFWPQ